MNMERFYVTTPIYYVNDVPHIGHAYTTIAGDIMARHARLAGKEVFFLTGTDEHGQKVEKAATENNRSPQQHADLMVENFKRLWVTMNISNDAFIRTTDADHMKTVQGLIQMLWDRGEIEKRKYSGWYCTPDERFWTGKEIVDGSCPDCGRGVEKIHEDNYFFLMSKYQERLIKHIEDNPSYISPETRRNEVMGFLKNNTLDDLCISRPKSRLSWGVPFPFDTDFVVYVWFDALVNYFSATRYLVPGADHSRLGEFWWPASHHIVGKDILTTHAVYWSTMLMALDLPLPGNIFAHGWWTVEGRKMSKSLGNVVDPHTMAEGYGTDAFRYFLFREVPFGLDGDFSESALIQRINTDLANDLGNLVSRTLTMLEKYRAGKVPGAVESRDREGMENKIKSLFDSHSETGLQNTVDRFLGRLQFHSALAHVWKVVGEINEYIAASVPWKEKDDDVLSNTLYTLTESLRLIAICIFPVMPSTGNEIWRQLGIEEHIDESVPSNPHLKTWSGYQLSGRNIAKGKPLFPRIQKKESHSKADNGRPSEGNLISLNEFSKVELKIGEVVHAERVAKSRNLIKLLVDTGDMRQIVAGIGDVYSPESLRGRKIVIVTNLQPAKLMGIESQGMLLAATDSDGVLSILIPDRDVAQGAKIK